MKMNRAFLTFVLIIALLITAIPVNAASFEDGVGKDEIPYGEFSEEGFTPYKYTSFNMMTEDEAVAAGVPEGYEGYVLGLTGGSSGVGVALDLHEFRIKDVISITFRVYCPAGTKNNGVRLTNTSTDTWLMLADPGATEEWVEVVYTDINKLDDGNGFCKYTTFVIRYDGAGGAVYIDAIDVKLRDPDTVPPVITYNGESEINTSEGKKFVPDLTAYDAYYGINITPEYIWSDGAVDADGNLLKGTHTCVVRATDDAGNSSEITLTVNVEERDKEAPVLNWTPDDVSAMAGALPILDITATDNRDSVTPVIVWSEGALDGRGKLTEGEHTLTITATDLTGNSVEHVVNFHVSKNRPTPQNLVEE